jgi:hypothetical protein
LLMLAAVVALIILLRRRRGKRLKALPSLLPPPCELSGESRLVVNPWPIPSPPPRTVSPFSPPLELEGSPVTEATERWTRFMGSRGSQQERGGPNVALCYDMPGRVDTVRKS